MKRPHGFDDTPRQPGTSDNVGAAAGRPVAPRGESPQQAQQAQEAQEAQQAPRRHPRVPEQQSDRRAQNRPDQNRPDQNRPDPTRPAQNRPAQKSASQQAAAEAKAARQRLRAAKRDRRRYERSEVRRFTQRSRRRHTMWIVSLTSIFGLVAFVLIGAFSPLMALRTIEVEGASRIDANAIIASLDDQVGRPLTLVDRTEIEKALASFPLIRSYSTESSPPNTLIVRIVERTPVALLAAGRGFDLVDSAGVMIETSPKRPEQYPLITTATGDSTGTGFTTAISVLLALPDDLKAKVDTISAGTQDDVTLTLVKGGPKVVWGSADDAAFKAVVLSRLIERTNPTKVHEYDVSSPNTAVVR